MNIKTLKESGYINYFNQWEFNKATYQYMDNDIVVNSDALGNLRKSMIYFLVTNNEIVYVGQTNVNPNKRLNTHRAFLDIDSILIIELENNIRDIVNYWEKFFIDLCNPCLNWILTEYEKNNKRKQVTVTDILNWGNNKNKRPGRPKIKTEPTKTINIAIPVSVLEQVEIALAKYQGNLTKYINTVVKKDLDNNWSDYVELYQLIRGEHD